VAGTIDGKDAKAKRGKRPRQRQGHVGLIARCAMEQKYGAALDALGRRIDDMNRAAVHRDALAGRRKAPFEAARLDLGKKPKKRQDRRQARKESLGDAARRHSDWPWTALVNRSTLLFRDSS
jgi:hypothetical protein